LPSNLDLMIKTDKFQTERRLPKMQKISHQKIKIKEMMMMMDIMVGEDFWNPSLKICKDFFKGRGDQPYSHSDNINC